MIVQFKYYGHITYPYPEVAGSWLLSVQAEVESNRWFKAWHVSRDKEYLVIKVFAGEIYTIIDDRGIESSFNSRHFKNVNEVRDQRLNKLGL